MIRWIIFTLLFVLNVAFTLQLKDPKNLIEVKERYTDLIEYIKNNPVPKKFKVLEKRILVDGYHGYGKEIGYNVNKGAEIGLCLDGTPNQMFHVLIHELAHSTVDEYNHSEEFWNNFRELKDLCVNIGLYTEIPEHTEFCGKYIRD